MSRPLVPLRAMLFGFGFGFGSRSRSGSGALLGLALCTAPMACGDDTGPPASDASSTGETGQTSADGSSDTNTDTDTDTESEDSGGSDLPAEFVRPQLHSPAEAEDLDPAPDIVHVALSAAPHSFWVGDQLVDGWAYNGQVPGPTIRLQTGDTLIVDFQNELGADTTVHWHGLHVPFAMDGVTWQGAPVGPGESFQYSFTVEQSGTYWYHPHVDSERQVDLGLYGVIVVEDPQEPVADRELVVVFDSWDEYSFDNSGEAGHGGLDGATLEWTTNGLLDPVFPATAGERIRVRAVNVANAGYVDLRWPQMRQIGSDQGLLPALREPESVALAPSDRMEGEWLIGGGFEVVAQPYSILGAPAVGTDLRLFEVQVEEPGAAPSGLDFPFDGAEPTPDPGWTDIVYAFHGDPQTGRWTINGEQFPDITIETLTQDQWSVIELRNISQAAHPYHLHGHGFEVLSVDGVAPPFRVFEDSYDVPPYATVRLGLDPDNPGDWMSHCHILPHLHGGMMTVLRVEAP